ncbi:MAG: hypothetical protein KatS3mg076_2330 [Candidatus Binatia bacterium]|nr:MAG: hypothetical protein KatS3mg076_2330 [Candidatus Binatia bacterium]
MRGGTKVREMRSFRRSVSVLFFGGLFLGGSLRAEVHSDRTAAVLVFPKIVVSSDLGVDTLVRIANASSRAITLQCFYVNATPLCVDGEGNCIVDGRFEELPPCTGRCEDRWQETDFRIVLTQNQPVAWLVSSGAVDCRSTPDGDDADPNNNIPCFPLDGVFRTGPSGENNAGSRIPPVAEDPFIGELKCVAVDQNDQPVERNDLYGEAAIVQGGRRPRRDSLQRDRHPGHSRHEQR